MSDRTSECPVCAARAPDTGPCEWCRAGEPVPECPTCRESGPEGQTLLFATTEVTAATCQDCRDWIRDMQALGIGYPRRSR